jgi:hypothetical protein
VESVAVELDTGDAPSGGVPLGIPLEPSGGDPPDGIPSGGFPPLGGAPLNPSGGVPPCPPWDIASDDGSVVFDCILLLFTIISFRLLFSSMAVVDGVRFASISVAFLTIVGLAVGDEDEFVAEVWS